MPLEKHISRRLEEARYRDALPAYVSERIDEGGSTDTEDIDLTVPMSELYSKWTTAQSAVTTLFAAAALWGLLLAASIEVSVVKISLSGYSVDSLLSVPGYGYATVALAAGTGISTAVWYVRRAPPEMADELGVSPAVAFVASVVVSGLLFLAVALVAGAVVLGATIAVFGLGVAAMLAFFSGIYAIFKKDGELAIQSLVVFLLGVVVVNIYQYLSATGSATYYGLVISYVLAVPLAVAFPWAATRFRLGDRREELGRVRVARRLVEQDVDHLRETAPPDYTVEVSVPDGEASGTESLQATFTETFELIDAYERHLDVATGSLCSEDESRLTTVVEATHPERCSSAAVASDVVDTLTDFETAYERLEATEFEDGRVSNRLLEPFQEVNQTDTVTREDAETLRRAYDEFDDWVADMEQRAEFRDRVAAVRDDLVAVYDDPPEVELSAESVSDSDWDRLERYERLVSMRRQVTDLDDRWPDAELSEAVSAALREDAVDARDIEPYVALVETAELALDVAEEHGSPFDRVSQQIVDIARTDPAERADDVEALREVLERGSLIAAFLDRVAVEHPAVEAAEWQTALATAVDETFPDVLRPIDSRIEAMADGMWEHADLFEYEWQEFESLIGSLYADKGYDVEVTSDTNDAGVDVWARTEGETVAIQVKQNSVGNTVGRPVLQKLGSTIAKGSADRVVVVTSSEFADTAVEYAADFGHKMDIVDGEELLRELSTSDLPPPT